MNRMIMIETNGALRVQIVDAERREIYPALLRRAAAGYHLERLGASDPSPDVPDVYLSPGWIDLHAHVYDGVASLSVAADTVGLRTGVHLVADAGSAGEATLPGLLTYVAPRARTAIRAWLNISSIGLVHLRELSDPTLLDVERTVNAAVSHRPSVCGIKVRSSGAIVGAMGLQPLKLARLAARLAGLPLMAHIGEPPPVIEDVLDLLDEGDVVTHCFHGKVGRPWLPDGRPAPALERALARGVRLDIGHGAASFSYAVAEGAIAAGVAPHSISTDAHVRNVRGPVYDLPTTMGKLLRCGMSLLEVIRAVTVAPAAVLGDAGWASLEGTLQRATLFRLEQGTRDSRVYPDAGGDMRTLHVVFVPVGVLTTEGLDWFDDRERVACPVVEGPAG